MKALIYAVSESVVCRVAKTRIKNVLIRLNYDIYLDKKDFENYDLVLFFSSDFKIEYLNKVRKDAITGILDPKLNTPSHISEAENVDFLLVSSLEQQLYAQRFNRNSVIYNWFPELGISNHDKQKSGDDKLVIGYQGNKVHLHCFQKDLKHVFERLYDENYNFKLMVIYDIKKLGLWKKGRPNIEVEDIQWQEDNYLNNLALSDIGIIPNLLPVNKKIANYLSRINFIRNHFNYNRKDFFLRFKMNSNPNRFWEFSQLKIPIVSDLYPSSCYVIDNGNNGFLAYDQETWYHALKNLLDNTELRQKFSENLYSKFNSELSPQNSDFRLMNILNKLIHENIRS